MSEVDPAHVLFPDDAPVPTEAPEWFKAEQAAATMRLMGSGKGKSEKPANAEQPANPAGDDGEDAASKLFPDDGKSFDETVVSGFLDPYARGAFSDGDKERGEALKAATTALAEDFKAAGSDSREVEDAFAIVRETNDQMEPATPEKNEEGMAASLASLQDELGSSLEGDLNAARAFIRDLETISPGTVAALEHRGVGNNLKLVRAVIKESRRRGY